MRRLLVIVLLLIAPGVSMGAIGHDACPSTCNNFNTNTSSLTVGANNWTAGHFLFLGIRAGTSVTINTPTSANNTFTCFAAVDVSTTARERTCYAFNIAGGSDTITFTTSANTNLHATVDSYNGVATACDPVEVTITATATAATSVTTGSFTITNATGLLGHGGISGNVSFSAGTNFILRQTTNGNNGRSGNEDRLGVTAGSFTASINTGSSTDIAFRVIAITPSGSCPATGGAIRHRAVQD